MISAILGKGEPPTIEITAAVGAGPDVDVGSVTKRIKFLTPSVPSSLQMVIGAIGFYHTGSSKVGGSTVPGHFPLTARFNRT